MSNGFRVRKGAFTLTPFFRLRCETTDVFGSASKSEFPLPPVTSGNPVIRHAPWVPGGFVEYVEYHLLGLHGRVMSLGHPPSSDER